MQGRGVARFEGLFLDLSSGAAGIAIVPRNRI